MLIAITLFFSIASKASRNMSQNKKKLMITLGLYFIMATIIFFYCSS